MNLTLDESTRVVPLARLRRRGVPALLTRHRTILTDAKGLPVAVVTPIPRPVPPPPVVTFETPAGKTVLTGVTKVEVAEKARPRRRQPVALAVVPEPDPEPAPGRPWSGAASATPLETMQEVQRLAAGNGVALPTGAAAAHKEAPEGPQPAASEPPIPQAGPRGVEAAEAEEATAAGPGRKLTPAESEGLYRLFQTYYPGMSMARVGLMFERKFGRPVSWPTLKRYRDAAAENRKPK